MQFAQCITALECILGLTHLEPDNDGVYEILIDKKLSLKCYSRQSFFTLVGNVGESISFSDKAESLLKSLLMSNMGMIYESSDILCLDSVKGQISLIRKLKEGSFSMNEFQKELDSFINDLAIWNEIFNNLKSREISSLGGSLPNFSYSR